MVEQTWNEEKIRAAFSAAAHTTTTGFVVNVEKLISELSTRTLRPRQPVLYDAQVCRNAIGYMQALPPNVTNVRALFTEDGVMGLADDYWNRMELLDTPYTEMWNWWQAHLDAIKYGSSDE